MSVLQTAFGWCLVAVAAFCSVWAPVPTKRRPAAAALALAISPLLVLTGPADSPSSWVSIGFVIAFVITAWVLAPVILSPAAPSTRDAEEVHDATGSPPTYSSPTSSPRT